MRVDRWQDVKVAGEGVVELLGGSCGSCWRGSCEE